MNSSDQNSIKLTLRVAERNLVMSAAAMQEVAWPKDMVGISKSVALTRLALQQTINVLRVVIDDL